MNDLNYHKLHNAGCNKVQEALFVLQRNPNGQHTKDLGEDVKLLNKNPFQFFKSYQLKSY